MNIPCIETKRLILRGQKSTDWDKYESFMCSERSIYMGGPYGQSQAWGWFCSDLALWILYGHGALMIDDIVTGDCVGQVGINDGPLFPEQELGWFLYSGWEGKGYAYEAAISLRSWAIQQGLLRSLVSYISPANRRSRNLALKLGAVIDRDATRFDSGDLVFRHSLKQAID